MWACLCSIGLRSWLSRRAFKRLLLAKKKQEKSTKALFSVASERASDCYKKLVELNHIDAERFEENKQKQAVVVTGFLLNATEQVLSCCARLEELAQFDIQRFEEEKQAVALFLSTLSERARTCWERLEQLNQKDTARFIEQKQAEAVENFLSLSAVFLSEPEGKMSVMGFELKRKNEKENHSHANGQQGWKENGQSPDYENLDSDAVPTSEPEGYVLLTSKATEGEEEDGEGERIYENIPRKSLSIGSRSRGVQLVQIHSQPTFGGGNDIMISVPLGGEQASRGGEGVDDGEDIYVDQVYDDSGSDGADEVEEIYGDASAIEEGKADELYDNLDSISQASMEPLYDRTRNFQNAMSNECFSSSAQYSRYGVPHGSGFQPESREPPRFNGHRFDKDCDLYVDVSSAMSEPPVKARRASPAAQARKKLSSVQMEPLQEETDMCLDMDNPAHEVSGSPPNPSVEDEHSIYENADSIRLQLATASRMSVDADQANVPMVITQQGAEQGHQRISITIHATGNSPLDSEDYDDAINPSGPSLGAGSPKSGPPHSPRNRPPFSPSPPPAPHRSPSTRLTTVSGSSSGGQAGGGPTQAESKLHRGNVSSSSSSEPFPHVQHSRHSSMESDVFIPETPPPSTAPKPSMFLSPRQSRRRSAIKTKSASSAELSVRKVSAPLPQLASGAHRAKKQISKQISEPFSFYQQSSRIQNLPLPPVPNDATSAQNQRPKEDDDIYDYANTDATTILYEDPSAVAVPQPYVSPVKRGGNKQQLGKSQSVNVDIGDGVRDWMKTRPPAILPPTLSRDRPPAMLPSENTPHQSAGFREPSPQPRPGAIPSSARGAPPRNIRHATPTGSAVLPSRNVRRGADPLPPLPTDSATPLPAHVTTPSAPPLPASTQHTPPPGRGAPPLSPSVATTPSAPPLPPSTRHTPPPPAPGAPPSPPLVGSAMLPKSVDGAPPPPPPPPVGGTWKQSHSSTNQNPPQKAPTPPTSRNSTNDLLTGITSVKLKAASERPLPEQPSLNSSGGGMQGNLMSEMQSRLKKRVTKTRSEIVDTKEQIGDPSPPESVHFKLRPTSSIPATGKWVQSSSSPPPHQGRSPPVQPRPAAHNPVVLDWKRELQQRRQKASVPKVHKQ